MNLTKNTHTNEAVESTRGYYYESPATDIYETDDFYKIVFDVPGIEKEDIAIKVEKDVLTITAESKRKPEEGYDCISTEMEFNGYKRAFNLNGTVDTDKIDADLNNGTLYLTLYKKEEQKRKEIKINIS